MNKYIKLYEDFNPLNIFRKNKKYTEYEGDEIDPYGEEDWDEDNLTPVLKKEFIMIYDVEFIENIYTLNFRLENIMISVVIISI